VRLKGLTLERFFTLHDSPPCRIAEPACAAIAKSVLKQRVHTVAKATDVCLSFIELEQGVVVMVRVGLLSSGQLPGQQTVRLGWH